MRRTDKCPYSLNYSILLTCEISVKDEERPTTFRRCIRIYNTEIENLRGGTILVPLYSSPIRSMNVM